MSFRKAFLGLRMKYELAMSSPRVQVLKIDVTKINPRLLEIEVGDYKQEFASVDFAIMKTYCN